MRSHKRYKVVNAVRVVRISGCAKEDESTPPNWCDKLRLTSMLPQAGREGDPSSLEWIPTLELST